MIYTILPFLENLILKNIFYYTPSYIIAKIGIVFMIIGLGLRYISIYTAGNNFTHRLACIHKQNHKLITTGIYAWIRHPSYLGSYLWFIGGQIFLQNPISFLLYNYLLLSFFFKRIEIEESDLTIFFGKRYIEYRKQVPFSGFTYNSTKS